MSAEWASFSAPLAFAGFIALFAGAGLAVLAYDSPAFPSWRAWVRKVAGRRSSGDLDWLNRTLLTVLAATAFALAAATTWLLGGYSCGPHGPSDLATLIASGHAFLTGGDPFTITACGLSGNPVPAGAASVLLDAVGSLGGRPGILLVWGAVSVSLVPLLWSVGGADRATATTFVLVSLLYLPIVAAQVDGASLALVPLAVLLVLWLSRQGWTRAAALGGFLATGRFPAIFPVAAVTGRAGARRLWALLAAVGMFAAVTAITVAAYGNRFLDPVFFLQFGRSHFALNYWGILEGEGWLAPSRVVTVVQALITVAAVGACWVRARSELGAASIVLVVTVLLAQFLSFTELVFLVPVALTGRRSRWWLWAIGVVGSANYLLALRALADLGGAWWLSYGLDILLSGLLVGLLADLVRGQLSWAGAPPSPSTSVQPVAAGAQRPG